MLAAFICCAPSCLGWISSASHRCCDCTRSARGADSHRTELRNLMVDSTLGAVWAAVMEFNQLPSVLLLTSALRFSGTARRTPQCAGDLFGIET
jgi:hypothetical protein